MRADRPVGGGLAACLGAWFLVIVVMTAPLAALAGGATPPDPPNPDNNTPTGGNEGTPEERDEDAGDDGDKSEAAMEAAKEAVTEAQTVVGNLKNATVKVVNSATAAREEAEKALVKAATGQTATAPTPLAEAAERKEAADLALATATTNLQDALTTALAAADETERAAVGRVLSVATTVAEADVEAALKKAVAKRTGAQARARARRNLPRAVTTALEKVPTIEASQREKVLDETAAKKVAATAAVCAARELDGAMTAAMAEARGHVAAAEDTRAKADVFERTKRRLDARREEMDSAMERALKDATPDEATAVRESETSLNEPRAGEKPRKMTIADARRVKATLEPALRGVEKIREEDIDRALDAVVELRAAETDLAMAKFDLEAAGGEADAEPEAVKKMADIRETAAWTVVAAIETERSVHATKRAALRVEVAAAQAGRETSGALDAARGANAARKDMQSAAAKKGALATTIDYLDKAARSLEIELATRVRATHDSVLLLKAAAATALATGGTAAEKTAETRAAAAGTVEAHDDSPGKPYTDALAKADTAAKDGAAAKESAKTLMGKAETAEQIVARASETTARVAEVARIGGGVLQWQTRPVGQSGQVEQPDCMDGWELCNRHVQKSVDNMWAIHRNQKEACESNFIEFANACESCRRRATVEELECLSTAEAKAQERACGKARRESWKACDYGSSAMRCKSRAADEWRDCEAIANRNQTLYLKQISDQRKACTQAHRICVGF